MIYSEYIREKLTVRFLIRMTETEKKALEKKAEALNISQAECLRKSIRDIPMIEKKDERYFFNPGSISLPKNNSNHSFAILDETKFQIKDLDENILMEINF